MKHLLIVMVALTGLLAANAQKVPKEKTVLWQISGNGLTQPSYVFGTFHILCPEDFHLPDTLPAIIRNSKQVYFEIDLDDPQMMAKSMKGMKMKDGHTLKEYLSATDYDSLSKIFQTTARLPLNMVQSYKPFLVSAMIYPSLLGCTPVQFEAELKKLAQADSLPIYGLETIEHQLEIFDSIPYAAQADMLKRALYGLKAAKKQMQRTVQLYKDQHIDKMYQSIEHDEDLSGFDNLILNQRNSNWIPVMTAAIKSQPTFFAVGAGHLGGKKGILYLLRQAGFTVTPVYTTK